MERNTHSRKQRGNEDRANESGDRRHHSEAMKPHQTPNVNGSTHDIQSKTPVAIFNRLHIDGIYEVKRQGKE